MFKSIKWRIYPVPAHPSLFVPHRHSVKNKQSNRNRGGAPFQRVTHTRWLFFLSPRGSCVLVKWVVGITLYSCASSAQSVFPEGEEEFLLWVRVTSDHSNQDSGACPVPSLLCSFSRLWPEDTRERSSCWFVLFSVCANISQLKASGYTHRPERVIECVCACLRACLISLCGSLLLVAAYNKRCLCSVRLEKKLLGGKTDVLAGKCMRMFATSMHVAPSHVKSSVSALPHPRQYCTLFLSQIRD